MCIYVCIYMYVCMYFFPYSILTPNKVFHSPPPGLCVLPTSESEERGAASGEAYRQGTPRGDFQVETTVLYSGIYIYSVIVLYRVT